MQSIQLNTNKRCLLAIAAAVLAVTGISAAIFGVSSSRAQHGAGAEPPATPVSVATVVQSDVSAWDEFSGRLEAVERVDIRSRVAGTIQAVHFREGALVKKGDLLLTIDPAPYAADVERADAQVAAAQARVAQARG
ncbi:MAG: biotin/lipoyl-binding protein, partial [Polaromonas sp.]